MRIVEVGSRSIGVYNAGGELFGVLNVCPHQLAPICLGTVSGTLMPSEPGRLVYGLDNRVLRCPWHGWEFDLSTGSLLFRSDKRRLLTFEVTVVDGNVLVDDGRPAQAREAVTS